MVSFHVLSPHVEPMAEHLAALAHDGRMIRTKLLMSVSDCVSIHAMTPSELAKELGDCALGTVNTYARKCGFATPKPGQSSFKYAGRQCVAIAQRIKEESKGDVKEAAKEALAAWQQ